MKIRYHFTDRCSGVTTPLYDTLNLAFHVNNNQTNVIKNRTILQNRLNLQNIVWMEQVHKDNIQTISSAQSKPIPACNTTITNQPNIALTVMVADCIG